MPLPTVVLACLVGPTQAPTVAELQATALEQRLYAVVEDSLALVARRA